MPLWVGFYCPARPTFFDCRVYWNGDLSVSLKEQTIQLKVVSLSWREIWDETKRLFVSIGTQLLRPDFSFFFIILALFLWLCYCWTSLNDQQPSGDVSCRAVEFYIIYPASIIKMRREKEDENGHRELRFVERRREKQHGLRELWRKFPSFLFVCFLLLWFDYETRNKSEVASWLSFIWCMLMNLPSTRRE